MKIKFESKTEKTPFSPSSYTFFIESRDDDVVDFKITKPIVRQGKMLSDGITMEKADEPISDGVFKLTKKELKKLVGALKIIMTS